MSRYQYAGIPILPNHPQMNELLKEALNAANRGKPYSRGIAPNGNVDGVNVTLIYNFERPPYPAVVEVRRIRKEIGQGPKRGRPPTTSTLVAAIDLMRSR